VYLLTSAHDFGQHADVEHVGSAPDKEGGHGQHTKVHVYPHTRTKQGRHDKLIGRGAHQGDACQHAEHGALLHRPAGQPRISRRV